MTDQPIPAAKPVAVPSATSQGSAATPLGQRSALSNLPVRQAPPALQNPPQTIRVQGSVISSNPQAQELRIQTSSGQVVVQSSADLPPDTQVTVDLAMLKGQEIANIVVLRQQAQVAQLEEQLVMPQAPPLRPGDTVQAILIPEPPATTSTTPAAVPATAPLPSLVQAAQVIENFPPAAISQLPQPLPVSAPVLAQIVAAPNKLNALQNLEPIQQAQVIAFMARPDVTEVLKRVLPPDIMQSVPAADETTPAAGMPLKQDIPNTPSMPYPQQETSDEDLLQIVTSQSARLSQDAALQAGSVTSTTPSAPQAPGALAVMKSLLPLLETLQSEAPSSMTLSPLSPPPGQPLAAQMPQSMYQVKIVSVEPPGAPPAQIPAGAQQGVVESLSPSGYPVVRTTGGLFILNTLATVTVGSTVTFEAKSLTPQQAISTATPAKGVPGWFDPLTVASWPALEEAMQAVSASAPMMAQAMREAIPAPSGQNMAPATLFFLAAVRTGDIANWLGEPVLQALKTSGKTALVQRLGADFARIAEQTKDALPDGWRATSMPMRYEEGITQLQLFVRQQQDQQGGKKDEGGPRPVTRFILNLRLSRLGEMQLDGLLNQRRLDLILRSAAPLSAAMRQDIMQSFQSGLRQAEMVGAVSFQPKAENWVTVTLPQRGTLA